MPSLSGWELEPLVVMPLALAGGLSAIGVSRLWRRAGIGRGIAFWAAGSFAAGWIALAVALLSPIASAADSLLSVHMTQHTLLMLVAAPLLTFGHPGLAWIWAFGDAARERVAHVFRRPPVIKAWQAATAPLAAFLIQAAALWIWHIPTWYEAALGNEAIHALQHLSFVLAGSLFWWAMVHGRYGRLGYGLGVLYVFLTGVHTSALGALLTVAPSVWYPHYVGAAHSAAGHSAYAAAAADQQLAGVIMWVPASVVFIVLGLALCAAWLGEAERRVRLGAADAASRLLPLIVLVLALGAGACRSAVEREAETLTGGRVAAGKAAIGKYGCAACHTIPGIAGATAVVGPPLSNIAVRQYLGGHLVNTPDNMEQWLQHPQKIDPKNAMPEMGVTDEDARDITAFLYTLR
jgi:putative membrane protein